MRVEPIRLSSRNCNSHPKNLRNIRFGPSLDLLHVATDPFTFVRLTRILVLLPGEVSAAMSMSFMSSVVMILHRNWSGSIGPDQIHCREKKSQFLLNF